MNKKGIAISCVAAVIVILVVFFIVRGNSFSVVGEWVIDYYIMEDGNVSQEDIGEYYGQVSQTGNSVFSVIFGKDGKATIYLPTYIGTETEIRECDYKIDGDYIYLYAEGEEYRAFEIKDDGLIVYGILSFDGNVVLKKK